MDYMIYPKPRVQSLTINHFIMFLKFIAFNKKLDYQIQKFDDIAYRDIIFRVKDFSHECYSLFKSSDVTLNRSNIFLDNCNKISLYRFLVTLTISILSIKT